MTQTKLIKRFGAALVGLSLLAGTAHAAGTDAGTTVSNTFTLNYDVGGTPQPQIDNSGSPTQFTVDRLVDLTITSLDPTLSVAPGSSSTDNRAVFRLTNLGNDVQAYDLSVADSGDYSPTTTNIFYFVDTNGNDILDGGESLQTYSGANQPDDIPADAQIIVYVETDVPGSATDGDSTTLVLTADTLYPTNPGTACTGCVAGSPVTGDSDGNSLTGEAETVLADGSGVTDANNQGDFSAQSVLTVLAPTLNATKSVLVFETAPASEAACVALSSPASADEYSVPGACIRYEISVQNIGSGSAANLVIEDQLPAEVRFLDATTTGFADDTGIAGAGPILVEPGSAVDCDGVQNNTSNCHIALSDAILAGGNTGVIHIWALVQ